MKLTMQPGVLYRARQAGHEVFIDGHFFNGQFYQGRHIVGQVKDGGALCYFEGLPAGRPSLLEHLVGHVDGLVLVLKDGTLFNLVEVDRQILGAG